MDPETLALRFRERIERELAEVIEQTETGVESRRPVELDQQSVGRLSRMDAMQMQAMAQAVEQRLKLRRVQLEQALSRIAEGEFGFCADCGEPIAEKRLEIDPAAARCIHCAQGL